MRQALVGIDVGGTHTDAVALERSGPGKAALLAWAKVPTDKDVLASVLAVLEKLLQDVRAWEISRLVLSTTLTTNALVHGKLDRVALIAGGGPGLDPAPAAPAGRLIRLPAAMDHRGHEVRALSAPDLLELRAQALSCGAAAAAVAGKFSVRNPAHELRVHEALAAYFPFISLGHRISGRLNFPRRIATVYYNAAAWRLHNAFVRAARNGVASLGINVTPQILKADGGAMPLSASRDLPVQAVASGPAASVLGCLALHAASMADSCWLSLDMGGSTTDLALFHNGVPLLERDGLTLGGRKTLVRGLLTRSIPVGGDCALDFVDGAPCVAPRRAGPGLAGGGAHPALVDAMNMLGLAAFGDVERSRRGVRDLARVHSFADAVEFARQALAQACAGIAAAARSLIAEANAGPIHTIRQLLLDSAITPSVACLAGGPAEAAASALGPALGLPVRVGRLSGVTSALGAALARSAAELELYADTERGVRHIPTLGLLDKAGPDYILAQAEQDARKALAGHLAGQGSDDEDPDLDITESSSFNIISDYGASGRILRVKCQVRPGLLVEFEN